MPKKCGSSSIRKVFPIFLPWYAVTMVTHFPPLSKNVWGMKINTSKCKVISSDKRNITINGEAIETVDKFTFLGSSVPAVADDVQRRINLAAWAFGRLRDKIWSNQNISRTIKVRIYKALILPIATYGSESWTLRKMDKNKLEVFEMRCLRTIAGVKLCDRVRNVNIRRELHIDKTITQEINKRQLTWFGHVARMPHSRHPYQAYKYDFTNGKTTWTPPAEMERSDQEHLRTTPRRGRTASPE